MKRLILIGMCILGLGAAGCSGGADKGKKSSKPRVEKTKKVKPKKRHVKTPPKKVVNKTKPHEAHEHGHGGHPHDAGAHHHHSHPHPHLDGPDGHHHPN